ncbi:Coiled-coil domain-containing protein 142 [Channa argus]|uniref:Coiled-coil domain-containing protein 142 n=1 Tax=Channa argus TaxID=215402 RepID=A0A6G1PTB0_CHAAH|nr:Coiled-coil domain-containing protein 142 [Channa argus]
MSGKEHHNPENLKDARGEFGLTAASWSQRSISRSLQRAESLLRSTFNPGLNWLFHGHNQDEDLEEENFVVAPNLVSRSSARLQRLQQALLTVAPQWQQVGGTQVCVKGLPSEDGVLLLPCSSFLQGHYRALWRLMQQRSLLLFIHEYLRRARVAAAFISRLSHLLEDQQKRSHHYKNLSSWSSPLVGLGSLSHELRVHLNHWSCLVSKVQSDSYLQPALVPQTQLLVEIKNTLDSLGLQAMVLMEHYVYVALSAVAQTDLNSVPREVLEDIVAGTDLYNQAVEEQKAQCIATQLRTSVLQQAHYKMMGSRLPNYKGPHPASFSIKELTMILAVNNAERAAKQLHGACEQSYQMCHLHDNLETNASSDNSISLETLKLTSEWTWENSALQRDGDPEKAETDCARSPHTVQWLDLGQSLVFDDLFGQYLTLLWTLCGKALWLQLHAPQRGDSANSINLQDNHRVFQILHQISQASKADLVSKECRIMLEDFSLCLLVTTSHAQWDYEMCRSLGSALKDKCLKDAKQGSHAVMSSPKQDGSVMMSTTMEHFLRLSPPLLSSLRCSHSNTQRSSGPCSLFRSRLTLQRQTLGLELATVQLGTVWVMSKAYQFLSSWSLNRFLLITQGDLKVLKESLEVMMHHTKSLMTSADRDQHSTSYEHNKLQMRQQLGALDRAVCELQAFSSLVLKTFSSGCKRMSGEIFEQTMPPAIHWRPRHRAGFPISPSEYASLAAQNVIGQVLEGVALLSDDARVQALSITTTAFMEAWMEHILKQKIKFSVQGALQLKQDFDSIREMIQSDKYGPANSSRASLETAVGSSITNLRSVAGEDLTQDDPSPITTNLSSVDGEHYLAPSVALGAAQQEWLNLRINSSSRRWRLPGLQCLSKSEP